MEGILGEAGGPHWVGWLREFNFAWGISSLLPQGHSTPNLFPGQETVIEASLGLPLSLGMDG